MFAVALVDYDNVRGNQVERTALDVAANLTLLGDQLGVAGARLGLEEIRARLYGGWVTQNNGFSQRANWMLVGLSHLRGLRSGVRVIPEMVTTCISAPPHRLIGTLRTDRNPIEQKMVDTLITADMIMYPACDTLLVVSDDDDMVPGLIAASKSRNSSTKLLRVRPAGQALNDAVLTNLAITIHKL